MKNSGHFSKKFQSFLYNIPFDEKKKKKRYFFSLSFFLFTMPKKQSIKSTPFSVKRKQINFNLLDNSSSSSFHHHHSVSTTTSINQDINEHLIKEKDETINELKKQLAQTNQELQTTRHEHRLMANEQSEFEANIIG
ncbi:hypothetical protein BDF21DRAFT_61214 [Thamnidium elegans]|nr:hypothetical protein BDF21DRAFT_61214 [Thamnidium elegans]